MTVTTIAKAAWIPMPRKDDVIPVNFDGTATLQSFIGGNSSSARSTPKVRAKLCHAWSKRESVDGGRLIVS
jgi:hypothetical protein